MEKVSVIVPVYNVEAFLGECLDSLCNQTYLDIEIILIDDGSTDKSGEICRQYAAKDHRIKILSQPNLGQSVARNRGLDNASGRYIMFVDSDDIVDHRIIERLVNVIETSRAEIAMCSFSARSHFKISSNPYRLFTPEIALEKALYQTDKPVNPSPWAKLFERSIWDNHRFPGGVIYEDLAVVVETFMAAKKIAVCDDVLYFYRERPKSTLATFSMRRMDVLKATDKISYDVSELGIELRMAADDRRLSACFNLFFLLTNNGLGGSSEADFCWGEIKRLRKKSLMNRRVRMKNKVGCLASFFGRKPLSFISFLVR